MFEQSPALTNSNFNTTLKPYEADLAASISQKQRIFIKTKTDKGLYTGFVQPKHPYLNDGLGVMLYSNKEVYEGEWLSGKRNGNGRLVDPEGCVYLGAWKDDEQTGYGTFENLVKGYRYEGGWLNKNYNGKGSETFDKIGSRYIGTFVNGKKQGQGRFEFSDGSFYEGGFLEGLFHGEGTYFFKDENKTFTGDFINGKIDG